jgi:dihydroxy-acid dehydratase
MHLLELAKKVKEGCEAEGMLGLTFNTIGVRLVRPLTIGRSHEHFSLVTE